MSVYHPITPDQFRSVWNARYPEVPPLSWQLKWHLDERWARIHSLPQSKRYADTPEEMAEILFRQNTIISELVEDASSIWVISCRWPKSFSDLPAGKLEAVSTHSDDDYTFRIFAWSAIWTWGSQDTILKLIADEKMQAIIMCNDCLIAPYDGGMDVILADSRTAGEFKAAYREWLPTDSDGF